MFKQLLSWLFVIILFSGIAYFANFRSPNVYDPDSFYHIRHSWVYKEHGLFYKEFPWLQYSEIKELKADLWYGFHLLLIPFTYLSDLGLGIKLAGFAIIFLVLWSFYFSLKNLGVSFPAIWASLFIFSSPYILYRIAMTRPHPLSLSLSIILFSFLIRGSFWVTFAASFLISWIHSALFWLPIMIYSVVFIFRIIISQRVEVKKFIAIAAGITVGLFARPNPIENLHLIYIQIVELFSNKKILDQVIGGELRPPGYSDIGFYSLILIIGFIAVTLLFIKMSYKKLAISSNDRVAVLSLLVLVFISILMYLNANRALDLLAAYIIMFSAFVISYYLKINPEFFSKKLYAAGILILIIFIVYYSIAVSNEKFMPKTKSKRTFKEPSLWLKENTNKGDIVFHLSWSQFPILFFWNQHNYYINGLDPVFLYAYDPMLHWKIFNIYNRDTAGTTCGFIDCRQDQVESTYDVLVNDFKASYIFVIKTKNPRFRQYLEVNKQQYEKVYDDSSSIIYKVLPVKK